MCLAKWTKAIGRPNENSIFLDQRLIFKLINKFLYVCVCFAINLNCKTKQKQKSNEIEKIIAQTTMFLDHKFIILVKWAQLILFKRDSRLHSFLIWKLCKFVTA